LTHLLGFADYSESSAKTVLHGFVGVEDLLWGKAIPPWPDRAEALVVEQFHLSDRFVGRFPLHSQSSLVSGTYFLALF
jgi:hypothetical protein